MTSEMLPLQEKKNQTRRLKKRLTRRRHHLCTNVLPPYRGGAVSSPMGMGRNGRTNLQRGSTEGSPPLSRTVFLLGRSLTGHNWVAPLLLIDRTPLRRLLILALLLISGNVHPNHPHTRYPAPCAILMCAEILFNALLDSSWCISFASPLPVQTFAQSVQLALQWAGVAQRAIPKGKLAPPLRPVSSLRHLRPLNPLPQGSPHYRLAFINRVHLGAPHVTPVPFALSR